MSRDGPCPVGAEDIAVIGAAFTVLAVREHEEYAAKYRQKDADNAGERRLPKLHTTRSGCAAENHGTDPSEDGEVEDQ